MRDVVSPGIESSEGVANAKRQDHQSPLYSYHQLDQEPTVCRTIAACYGYTILRVRDIRLVQSIIADRLGNITTKGPPSFLNQQSIDPAPTIIVLKMAMPQATNSLVVKMPLLMSITKLLSLVFTSLPFSHAAPTRLEASAIWAVEDENVAQPDNPSLWIYLAVAVALVLLGGAFAGLTIALMGQVGYSSIQGDIQ